MLATAFVWLASVLISTLIYFYHDDKLFELITKFCKVVAGLSSTTDDWDRLVKNKGVPLNLCGSDSVSKLAAEAEEF